MQWPVAYHYWKETGNKFSCLLDRHISALQGLMESQECVDKIIIVDRIYDWNWGGQPYHFNMTPEEVGKWDEVYHLGLRGEPTNQLTLCAKENVPIKAGEEQLAAQSLFVGPQNRQNTLIVHATATTHMGIRHQQDIRPRIWDVFAMCEQWFHLNFEEIVFIGSKKDKRMKELYDYKYFFFDDEGDFLKLAQEMNNTAFVLGAGSMGVVLAGILGVPSMRVHDPLWGKEDFTFWGNLGNKHANYYPQGAIHKELVQDFVEEQCQSLWAAKSTV